jgi:hypothetical protein
MHEYDSAKAFSTSPNPWYSTLSCLAVSVYGDRLRAFRLKYSRAFVIHLYEFAGLRLSSSMAMTPATLHRDSVPCLCKRSSSLVVGGSEFQPLNPLPNDRLYPGCLSPCSGRCSVFGGRRAIAVPFATACPEGVISGYFASITFSLLSILVRAITE